MKLSQILWHMETAVSWLIIQKAPQFTAKEAKTVAGTAQSCLNQEKTRTFPFLQVKRSHYRTREIEITDSAASDSLFKILIYWSSYPEMEQKDW